MKLSPNTLLGSKILDRVGADTHCAKIGIWQPLELPDHCGIFQTEVLALGKAAELAFAKTLSHSKINTDER